MFVLIQVTKNDKQICEQYLLEKLQECLRFPCLLKTKNCSCRMAYTSQNYNSSQAYNSSNEVNDSIYVFTPAGDFVRKLILCLTLSTLGITGFLGNCSIFYFLGKNKKRNGIQ